MGCIVAITRPYTPVESGEAHFVFGEDLEDIAVIDRHAKNSGIALHAALEDGSAANFVMETEMIGRKYGVQGTPAWLLGQRLLRGTRSAFNSAPAKCTRLGV
jgi:predicted DsbA family dithiol-disulfide isomerase